MNKKLLLTIDVKCLEAPSVKGQVYTVVMVPFTGTAYGDYFNGEIIGTGVDTQKYNPEGQCSLSARYMLQGKDCSGADCKIFIENSQCDANGWRPFLVTDSKYLAEWERIPLIATVDPAEGGVTVKIYEE